MKLLERDIPLGILDNALSEAIAGAGRIALVNGEAGIGKTSLVEAFTSKHAGSARVLWGACDPMFTPRPLGPLHDIAAHLHGSVPELLAAGANHGLLFSTFLIELRRQPTILVFEDVQWADEASLDLMRYLTRRMGALPLLLVLTYRDDELGLQHPLRALLGVMSSPASRRIQLAPLSLQAVETLLGERRVDANALHRQTGGNPFYLAEVLESGEDGIPPTIRDAVLARVAHLSLSGRAVLEAAAVLGMRVEPELLAAITSAETTSVDESLACGLLRAHGDLLTFRHELTRYTILESIAPHRKRVLHSLAFQALKQSPVLQKDLARLAYHAWAANERQAVLEYAPAAAEHAAAAGAHRQAASLYALSLQLAEGLQPQVHAAMLEAYARECNLTENQTEAISALQRAADLWEQLNKPLEEGKALSTMAIILRNSGDNPEAERVNRAAISMLEALPPSRSLAQAYRVQATLCLSQRTIAEAIQWGEKAVGLAEKFDDENVRLTAQTALGAAWLLTDFERGRQILEQCLETTLQDGKVTHSANIYTYIGSCSTELYQFQYAEEKLREGIAYTTERDLDIFTRLMLAWQALTQIRLGNWQQAAPTLDHLSRGLSHSTISRIPALSATGLLQARSGSAPTEPVLDEALQLAERTGTLQHLGMVRAVRAEAAWLRGNPRQARDEARAAYSLALSKEHAWLAGELAYWRWRCGDEVPVLNWMARPFALQITGDWKTAARQWERLGCPYEQARALEEGDTEAKVAALQIFELLGARPAANQLRGVLKTSGAVRLPRQPRQSTRQNPFGLTGRQVEILALLVQGLSNAEIAARLHISPKTTDHHVAAILRHLSVNSRQAAAELARRHPHFNPK